LKIKLINDTFLQLLSTAIMKWKSTQTPNQAQRRSCYERRVKNCHCCKSP